MWPPMTDKMLAPGGAAGTKKTDALEELPRTGTRQDKENKVGVY